MNQVGRWYALFAFVGLGCVATPGSDGQPSESNQGRERGASTESALSFVTGLPCTINDDCGRRAYCEYPAGQCGGWGTCETRPRTCAQVDAPVCGCDGHKHANDCVAAVAGVSVEHAGECTPGGARCGAVVCEEGLECCNPSCGICVPPGGVCTAQVCE